MEELAKNPNLRVWSTVEIEAAVAEARTSSHYGTLTIVTAPASGTLQLRDTLGSGTFQVPAGVSHNSHCPNEVLLRTGRVYS
jgi:hypothetical protein